MPRGIPLDLVGQRFGKWLVLEKSEIKRNRRPLWLCRCMGCKSEILVMGSNLTTGQSKGCRACYINSLYTQAN